MGVLSDNRDLILADPDLVWAINYFAQPPNNKTITSIIPFIQGERLNVAASGDHDILPVVAGTEYLITTYFVTNRQNIANGPPVVAFSGSLAQAAIGVMPRILAQNIGGGSNIVVPIITASVIWGQNGATAGDVGYYIGGYKISFKI